jgi:D-alanine-D-alanine ligase
VNPNPGWCWDGHLAKMAKIGEHDYSELLAIILQSAWNRINNNNYTQIKTETKVLINSFN